jgi:ferredoxin, 2Fe-2S
MVVGNFSEVNMPVITFIQPDGTTRAITAVTGESLMVAATREGIQGIIGECGGSAMCATCHCYLEAGILPAPESLEAETIEFNARHVESNSRLTCQVHVTEDMSGIVFRVAPE